MKQNFLLILSIFISNIVNAQEDPLGAIPKTEQEKLADASAASLKLPCKTAFGTESNVAIFDVKLLAPFLIGLGNLL